MDAPFPFFKQIGMTGGAGCRLELFGMRKFFYSLEILVAVKTAQADLAVDGATYFLFDGFFMAGQAILLGLARSYSKERKK
jgi:hypothetical protein